MIFKCPYCKFEDEFLPTHTPSRCPGCGELIEHPKQRRQEQYTDTKNNLANDLDLVRNTILWNLNPGEVARRIDVREFANISNAKGIYVQEGVTAILMIDGQIVTELSSGVYYFPTVFEQYSGVLRSIWRFFTGKKHGDNTSEHEERKGRLGSVLQNMKGNHIDVILMIKGVIPVVLSIGVNNGTIEFQPYIIESKLEDIEVGVTMTLEISDLRKFTNNYLTNKPYCRIYDLQKTLNSPIYNTLEDILECESMESSVIPPHIKERLKESIVNKANSVLQGVQVSQVIDIIHKSEDFTRFREIEHKLYCTEKELNYLIRTNDYKNRLQTEENQQKIREAKSEEELRYTLNLLNKDKLIHDDEMEAFCQLLANQKAIRTAQNEADLNEALLNIKRISLVNQDDFEALESELRMGKASRDEAEELFRWQSLRRTETERISAQHDINLLIAKAEIEEQKIKYEGKLQAQSYAITLEENQAEHIARINDIEIGIATKRSNFEQTKRKENHALDTQEERDHILLNNEEKNLEIDRIKAMQENAINVLAKIRELDRIGKAQDYEHEERITKMREEANITLARITQNMSAEQIAATKLDSLPKECQIAIATAISSQKEIDWIKTSNEEKIKLILELVNISTNIDKNNCEKQRSTDTVQTQQTTKPEAENVTLYKVAAFGCTLTFADMLAYIKEGGVTPDTELVVDEKICKAYNRPELRLLLYKMYGASCPNCGTDGLIGHICSECGTLI